MLIFFAVVLVVLLALRRLDRWRHRQWRRRVIARRLGELRVA